jgi:SAM-dependent methyltransferase
LRALYASFNEGLPAEMRDAMAGGEAWHATCVRRIGRLRGVSSDSRFTWLEIGAGAGEMACQMARAYPQATGRAADLHERPRSLPSQVSWLQVDLNGDTLALGEPADVVYATGVWEHVRRPDVFVDNLVRMLSKGGLLYLMCPNYASLARRLLDTRWPYFTPGEHLTMPSPRGAEACIRRAFSERPARIVSRPFWLTYSIRYTALRFGLPGARWMPAGWRLPMPVGALESVALT